MFVCLGVITEFQCSSSYQIWKQTMLSIFKTKRAFSSQIATPLQVLSKKISNEEFETKIRTVKLEIYNSARCESKEKIK
jgi:hypothetical protein